MDILKQGRIEDKVYYLPDIQLDRPLYESVNKALVALGAKWNKKSKGHVFDYDISQEMENVLKTGIVTDWKKSTDFFHTPTDIVNEMLGLVAKATFAEFSILEPSAGQGHIVDTVKDSFPNAEIICIEQNPLHCERLSEKGYSPRCEDFMSVEPFKVDVVLMNPPFSNEMEHIRHAYDFLSDEGQLITVCSAMVLDKSTKHGKAFKQWFEDAEGAEYILPPNSFKESGTNVNTKLLVFDKR